MFVYTDIIYVCLWQYVPFQFGLGKKDAYKNYGVRIESMSESDREKEEKRMRWFQLNKIAMEMTTSGGSGSGSGSGSGFGDDAYDVIWSETYSVEKSTMALECDSPM